VPQDASLRVSLGTMPIAVETWGLSGDANRHIPGYRSSKRETSICL